MNNQGPQKDGLFAKIFDSWISSLAGVLGVLLVGLLIFPFHFGIFLFTVSLAAASVLCLLQHRGQKRDYTYRVLRLRHYRWAAASVALAATSLIWAAAAPLVVIEGPLYICAPGAGNPLDAEITEFIPGASGRLVLFRDPVRPSLLPLAKRLRKDLRELKIRTIKSRDYVIFPLQSAWVNLRHTPAGFAIVQQRLTIRSIGLAIDIEDPSRVVDIDNSFGLGPSVHFSTGVSFSYPLLLEEPPLNAIPVTASNMIDVLRYGAALDNGLEAASNGDTKRAFQALQTAWAEAPSHLEAARTLLSLSVLAYCRLGGNLGQLQAIGYLYYATGNLMASSLQRDILILDDNSPSTRHTRLMIPLEMSKYQPLFGKTLSIFGAKFNKKQTAIEVEDSKRKSSVPLRELQKFSREMFSNAFHGSGFDEVEKDLFRLDSQKFVQRAHRIASEGDSEASCFLLEMAPRQLTWAIQGLFDIDAEILALREVAQRCNRPVRKTVLDSLDFFEAVASINSGKQPDVVALPPILKQFGFTRSGKLVELSDNPELIHKKFQLEPPPDAQWWTTEYLDWFGSQLHLIGAGVQGNLPMDYFIRDRRGKGELFIPGLAFTIKALEAQGGEHLQTAQKLRITLLEAIPEPLESTLYGVGKHETVSLDDLKVHLKSVIKND